MPDSQPPSVALNINRTSVMLYANQYVKLPDGSGATTQSYLGSFPRTAIAIPAAFEALLRQGTLGRPERYQALMDRVTEEALIPARIKREREETLRNSQALSNALTWAAKNLSAIPAIPAYGMHICRPEQQGLLKTLLQISTSLAADIVTPAVPPPEAEPSGEGLSPEQRLMPDAAQAFKRGYVFQPETIMRVQRLWFLSSDAVAALSARSQLRRPARWSALRSMVLAGGSAGVRKPD